MKQTLVLTLIGPDRPGLVGELSQAIASTGGNWERSRMADLGGQFVGLLEVSAEQQQVPALREALGRVDGLTLTVADSVQPHPAARQMLKLDILGNDHPGIVRDIFRVFASYNVNVEELETSTETAAESGGQLFRAQALLSCPQGCQIDQLQTQLEAIAADIMVDARLLEPA